MITAENYVPNNECAPNNEVFHISSYHSIIHGKCECERQVYVAHGETRSRAQLGKRRIYVYKYNWIPCLGEWFSPMCTNRIILCFSVMKDSSWWVTYRESTALP